MSLEPTLDHVTVQAAWAEWGKGSAGAERGRRVRLSLQKEEENRRQEEKRRLEQERQQLEQERRERELREAARREQLYLEQDGEAGPQR